MFFIFIGAFWWGERPREPLGPIRALFQTATLP
jgi:hypothetical protein